MELITVKKNEILQYYSHKCNEINNTNIGEEVVVFGWLRTKRDFGKLFFFELSDGTELIQIITQDEKTIEEISRLPLESVLQIQGTLIKRSLETINKSLKTGELEIILKQYNIFSKSQNLPFSVNTQENIKEELIYEYRYLHLRREHNKDILYKRAQVFQRTREFFQNHEFTEIQTPLLGASAPEGAKDFLVIANNFPGQFFCLPQAPQIYKQLLVNSGFSKYFQIAPCFRSESSRVDRLPGAFYQCDLEIGFGTRSMVMSLMEKFIINIFKEFAPHKKLLDFKYLSYRESMEKYCSDKPDLRNPLEIKNVTDLFVNTDFKVFKDKIDNGEKVFAINLVSNKLIDSENNYFKSIKKWAQDEFKREIGYGFYNNNSWEGSLKKWIPNTLEKNEYGVFLYCDHDNQSTKMFLNKLRTKLGEDLIDKNQVALCFITDFPMFEYDEDNKSWEFMHNPFCRPLCTEEDLKQKQDLHKIFSCQYDLVCNGVELGSGSERNASNEMMELVFECVGKDKNYYRENFKSMYKAFSFGVIPHSGIAIGLERTIMLLFDFDNVRFVEAFPFNQSGKDLMTNAPLYLTLEQKRELKSHLENVFPEQKKPN